MICFTKYDLLNDSEKQEINNLKEYYQSIGITVVINSEITKIKEILKVRK